MNLKYPVITISREYGAGGRSIARLLSEKTGLPWFDQEIVKEAAMDSGIDEKDILKSGEELDMFANLWDVIMNGSVVYTSAHEMVFNAQKEEIIKLAKKPCILVGRCANVILREEGIKTFNIFLYSDMNHKIERIGEMDEGKNIKDLKKFIEKREHLRKNHYRHFTGKELGNYRDYDLLINTGATGMEQTVQMILNAVSI